MYCIYLNTRQPPSPFAIFSFSGKYLYRMCLTLCMILMWPAFLIWWIRKKESHSLFGISVIWGLVPSVTQQFAVWQLSTGIFKALAASLFRLKGRGHSILRVEAAGFPKVSTYLRDDVTLHLRIQRSSHVLPWEPSGSHHIILSNPVITTLTYVIPHILHHIFCGTS